MALVFPSNPNVNDTYTVNGRTYVWNGTTWRTIKAPVPDVLPTLSVDNDFSAGGTLHVDSVNNEIGIGTAAPSHQLHLTQDLGVDGNLIVGGTITVPTPIAGTNDTTAATTAFVQNAISSKQDSSTALTTSTSFGGDVSGTYNAIVISDDSHNHVISNVDGLQTALDGKAASSHTHAYLSTSGGTISGTLATTNLNGVVSTITKSGAASLGQAGNNTALLVQNSNGDHSWGITAEFRAGGGGYGNDRPSILFSNGYNSTTWSVGFGSGSDDNFRINQNHGYRNGGWGTARLSINTSGVVTVGNLVATTGVDAGYFSKSISGAYGNLQAWSQNGGWICLEGGNGYLLIDSNYSDNDVYLRSYANDGYINIGAGGSNTLVVGNGWLSTSGTITSGGDFNTNNRLTGSWGGIGAPGVQMRSGNTFNTSWTGSLQLYVDFTHIKNFVIDHPSNPSDQWLIHACSEGPTADVFYRGEAQLSDGLAVIELPDYFEDLTELEGRTIMVTPIANPSGNVANLAAYEISNGRFVVEQVGGYNIPNQRFWWRVDAVRKNTSFPVQPNKSDVIIGGDGPYRYIQEMA